MAKSKAQKQDLVAQYKTWLENTTTLFVVKPIGVTVNESTKLKKELANLDATLKVVKNSLFKIALKEEGFPEIEAFEGGENMVLFSGAQISEAAKVISKFADETSKIELRAGVLNGNKISGADVKSLAELPSKEQLLAQLLGVMNGPMRNLVSVMSGNMREFLYLLNALGEKKAVA